MELLTGKIMEAVQNSLHVITYISYMCFHLFTPVIYVLQLEDQSKAFRVTSGTDKRVDQVRGKDWCIMCSDALSYQKVISINKDVDVLRDQLSQV